MSARIGNETGFVPPPVFTEPAVPVHAQDAAPEQAPDQSPQAPPVDEFVDADAELKAQIQDFFKQEFGAWAADAEHFHALLRDVFWPETTTAPAAPPAEPEQLAADGTPLANTAAEPANAAPIADEAITTAIEQYRQMALNNDYSWLPPIEFVDADTLQGANAAYSNAGRTVYLNSLLRNNAALAGQAYVEETGHHLDNLLHQAVDTAGDEGELFRRILAGEQLSEQDKAAIRGENDHGQLDINGKKVEVEFWSPMTVVRKVFRFVANGLGGGRMKFVGTAPVGKHKPRQKLKPRLPQPNEIPAAPAANGKNGKNAANATGQIGAGGGAPDAE